MATDPIPDGTYVARIVNVKEGNARSKKDGEPYEFRVLVWRIMVGPQAGGCVEEFLSFDRKENLHRVVLLRRAETLKTLGVDPKVRIDWQALKGKHAQIVVKAWTSDRDGSTKINVNSVFPTLEGEKVPEKPCREEIDLDEIPF